jgi:VIT1/CCC1 family predicted Fe2+/Mn2+ transporter
LAAEEIVPVVEGLKRRPTEWRDFMMKFELGLEEPDPSRAFKSAITIAGAYVAGGLIPLFPYVLISKPTEALLPKAAGLLSAFAGTMPTLTAKYPMPASTTRVKIMPPWKLTIDFIVLDIRPQQDISWGRTRK